METQTENTPATKRTKTQIDIEYTEVATIYGDRQFKMTLLQAELKSLFERMNQLNAEATAAALTSITGGAAPVATAAPEAEAIPAAKKKK